MTALGATAAGRLRRRAVRAVTRVWPDAPRLYRRLRSDVYRAAVRRAPGVTDRLGLRRRAFERAYRTGAWTSTGESLSGNGSSLGATEHLRDALPGLLQELGVRTLLDVPCGDWNWMSRLPLDVDRYVGGDLVPSVVEANRARHGDERHEFRVLDLCADDLPPADLLLCRDALIHFSSVDVRRALDNVLRSEITWLATTTFPATERNTDLETGIRWRHLNLQAPPFGLPPPLRALRDDFNRPDQVLAVWRVADLRDWRRSGAGAAQW